MADMVYRSAALFVCAESPTTYCRIKALPVIDAVSVVRCCDCEWGVLQYAEGGYYDPPTATGIFCKILRREFDFTDYCSHGSNPESHIDEDTSLPNPLCCD